MKLGKGQRKKYIGDAGAVAGSKRKSKGFATSSTTTCLPTGYSVELYPVNVFKGLVMADQSVDGSVILFTLDGEPFLVAGVYRDESDYTLKSAGYVLIDEPQYSQRFSGFEWMNVGRMV